MFRLKELKNNLCSSQQTKEWFHNHKFYNEKVNWYGKAFFSNETSGTLNNLVSLFYLEMDKYNTLELVWNASRKEQ
jgi:hypothetical protein